MNKSASLSLDEQKVELPVKEGTLGFDVVEVTSLSKLDVFTFDPGFMSTAACESKITYIDGEKGVLLHRGYLIKELCEHSNFLEVAFLLLYGELPTKAQAKQFNTDINLHTMVHEQLRYFFNGFRADAHPMAIMVGVVGALSAFYYDSLDITNPEHRRISAIRLIAKMPTIAAMCYKYSIGQPFMYPNNDLSYAENFLHMMFSTPCEAMKINPILIRAMDQIFIIHADHEQNASTSTVRMAGSTGANPFVCISAGIAALWGPAHGGANEAALNMLKQIGTVDRIPEFIARAKDPNDSFRLMGFGHRVYKNYDPRAKVMQQTCHEVLAVTGKGDSPLFKVAVELERIALNDEYFIQRKLYPNVDFYSGITLSALGIPSSMFTVVFALARTSGWISQWSEMVSVPNYKIARPRQLYTGATERDFVPMAERE